MKGQELYEMSELKMCTLIMEELLEVSFMEQLKRKFLVWIL